MNEDRCALRVRDLSKAYGATVALRNISIDLLAGEVHALLGENGAGKSTLVKVLSGVVRPNAGELELLGKPYAPRTIVEARASGVSTSFQELSLVSSLTVAQNLALPWQPKNRFGLSSTSATLRRAEATLQEFDLASMRPNVLVSHLSLAERQRLEIVRAMSWRPKVLILDEPTAALSEVDWLFRLVRRMTDAGTAVLYISHRLAEVRSLCQRATVLRNGSSIATVGLGEASDADIFEMMVGRSKDEDEKRAAPAAVSTRARVLAAEGLCGKNFNDLSLHLCEGEILGVAGLEGQGQRELFRTLVGLSRASAGKISIDQRDATICDPIVALKTGRGIAFVPEERKTEGIFPNLTVASNIALPVLGRIARRALVWDELERSNAARVSSELELSPRYLKFHIGELSGGNQQKALLARVMGTGAGILLLYDPTRGVDVGTKQAIYAAIRRYADAGGAVLLYSSELPELTRLSDRCLVVYGGRIFAELSGDQLDERRLVAALTGHAGHGAVAREEHAA